MTALEIPDDGFAEVTINGVTQQIDVYRTYNLLCDYDARVREEHPDEKDDAAQQVAYCDLLCKLLKDLGFGDVSHRAADKFDAAFLAAVADLKKADAAAQTPA